jgi:hypothetical protein
MNTPLAAKHPHKRGGARIAWSLTVLLCFSLAAFILAEVVFQFTHPALHRLRLVQDVPLPSAIVRPQSQGSTEAVSFDRFDAEALDQDDGLLFIAHPGPDAVNWAAIRAQYPPGTQVKSTLVVFDTKRSVYVGSIDVPDVHGLVLDPDRDWVYASDARDAQIYVIDVHTRAILIRISIGHRTCAPLPCDIPDALEYDPVHHKLYISDTAKLGALQDADVIDTQTNQFVTEIPLGGMVGQMKFDPVSQLIFTVVTPSTGATTGLSQFVSIDPRTDRVGRRVPLPNACEHARGLVLDAEQRIAFTACVNSLRLVAIDMRNLLSMKVDEPPQVVGGQPDILLLDRTLHVLYVASFSGVSLFDVRRASGGMVKKLGDYRLGSDSHTIAVDEATHTIYLALTNVGGRAMLRVEQYNPQGTV